MPADALPGKAKKGGMAVLAAPNFRSAAASTARFYEEHAAEYFRRTVDADLSNARDRFLEFVPSHGRILDAGCGSGRDLREFVRLGYRARGIDASRELVKLAADYASAPCEVMRLEDLPYSNRFDGIWACASLLHLPKPVLGRALHRFAKALVPNGVLFVSVQFGQGESLADDGRLFVYYTESEIEDAIRSAGFEVIDVWTSEDVLAGRESLRWVNVLGRVAGASDARKASKRVFGQ